MADNKYVQAPYLLDPVSISNLPKEFQTVVNRLNDLYINQLKINENLATKLEMLTHTNNVSNPHAVTYTQVGAEPANANIQEHIADINNPHLVMINQIEGVEIAEGALADAQVLRFDIVSGKFVNVLLSPADVSALPASHDASGVTTAKITNWDSSHTYILLANQAGGPLTLNALGKISSEFLEAVALTHVYVEDTLEDMNALEVQTGDVCIRTDENRTYIYKDTSWVLVQTPTDLVLSVNGKVGVIALNALDVGALPDYHDAGGVTSQKIINWDTAFGWGNHAGLYALVVHNHDEVYSAIDHDHDEAYAALAHGHALADLTDINGTPTDGQTFAWNTATSKFIPVSIPIIYKKVNIKIPYANWTLDGDIYKNTVSVAQITADSDVNVTVKNTAPIDEVSYLLPEVTVAAGSFTLWSDIALVEDFYVDIIIITGVTTL